MIGIIIYSSFLYICIILNQIIIVILFTLQFRNAFLQVMCCFNTFFFSKE